MRHTRSHTANRRSHHALVGLTPVKCANCEAPKIAHMICSKCGVYRGKVMIDVAKKALAKQAKAAK